MDRFESSIRKALREPKPPASLAKRVLARSVAREKPRFALLAYPIRTAAAAALAVVLGVGGLYYQRARTAQLESERAKKQLIRLFHLAAEQLRPFQERLVEVEVVAARTEEKE